MYLQFYGLKEKPFTLSPDPKYLYYSLSHKEAYSQFIYAVTQHCGFMVLTGEVGTGKTTIVNAMVNSLPREYHVARVYHQILSRKGLLQNICKEFGIGLINQTATELLIGLQEQLKLNHQQEQKSILVIDEAQNLKLDILEDIRLLSNFEDMDEKFLQIVLVGQPELDIKLRAVELRQLRQRIGLKYRLRTLTSEETANYINHRLKIAGYISNGNLFTEEAVDRVSAYSEGIPRRINILCDNALLMGYVKNLSRIDIQTIEKVLFDNIADDMDEIVKPAHSVREANSAQDGKKVSIDELPEEKLTDLDFLVSTGRGNSGAKNSTTTDFQINEKVLFDNMAETVDSRHPIRKSTPEIAVETLSGYDVLSSTDKLVKIEESTSEDGSGELKHTALADLAQEFFEKSLIFKVIIASGLLFVLFSAFLLPILFAKEFGLLN